jgi:hypothetical protein
MANGVVITVQFSMAKVLRQLIVVTQLQMSQHTILHVETGFITPAIEFSPVIEGRSR